MGIYINPENQTKEKFLSKHGKPLSKAPQSLNDVCDDSLPVCLVDNGWMTAAGVAESECDLSALTEPDDTRPKKWYAVLKSKLPDVCKDYVV